MLDKARFTHAPRRKYVYFLTLVGTVDRLDSTCCFADGEQFFILFLGNILCTEA